MRRRWGSSTRAPRPCSSCSYWTSALVGPLVSALHVNAVSLIGSGQRPKLVSVAQQGLQALPVVAAAQIIAGLGIGLGLIALVLPGIILALRWAVVAQVAATERTDWQGALRRSHQLTTGHYLHVFGVLVIASLVDYALARRRRGDRRNRTSRWGCRARHRPGHGRPVVHRAGHGDAVLRPAGQARLARG